jgi:hypothetical protein
VAGDVPDGLAEVVDKLGPGATAFQELNPGATSLAEATLGAGGILGADEKWYLGSPFDGNGAAGATVEFSLAGFGIDVRAGGIHLPGTPEPQLLHAFGFKFESPPGTPFSFIQDFPQGFDAPFDVFVDNVLIGSFEPGQMADFRQLGGPVNSFIVTGYSEEFVDSGNPIPFPLRVGFSGASGKVMISAVVEEVPEPSTLVLLATAAVLAASSCLRQRTVR